MARFWDIRRDGIHHDLSNTMPQMPGVPCDQGAQKPVQRRGLYADAALTTSRQSIRTGAAITAFEYGGKFHEGDLRDAFAAAS